MLATYPHEVTREEDYAPRLGAALREARYYRSMSREVLAALVNVSAETIARWERGTVTVPAYALGALTEALALPPGFLVDPPAGRSTVLSLIAAHDELRVRPGEPQSE